jgi:AcrR family transcriptional regulator
MIGNVDNDSAPLPRKRMTRAEKKAETRALLLDAAAYTFARKGFAGASVEEIAEAAGFSIGALYSQFGGKDKLFLALLADRASSGIGAAARIVNDEGAEAEDPAQALGRMLVEVADKDNDFALLQAEFWLYAVRNPDVMDVLAEQFRGPRDALADLIGRRLADVGQTSGASPEVAATIVLALFQGLVQQRRTDAESVPDDLFGRAVRWLFAGMTAESEVLPTDEQPKPTKG